MEDVKQSKRLRPILPATDTHASYVMLLDHLEDFGKKHPMLSKKCNEAVTRAMVCWYKGDELPQYMRVTHLTLNEVDRYTYSYSKYGIWAVIKRLCMMSKVKFLTHAYRAGGEMTAPHPWGVFPLVRYTQYLTKDQYVWLEENGYIVPTVNARLAD